MQQKNIIWVNRNQRFPLKYRKASLYSTSFSKPELPGILEMQLAMFNEHTEERQHTKSSVPTVGMTPDFSNIAGKFNMAGPAKLFTAIAMELVIPMESEQKRIIKEDGETYY